MRSELTSLLWVLLFLAGWATVATVGIASHIAIQAMVADVNSQVDEGKKFSELSWFPGKLERLLSEYSRIYPSGERIRKLRRLFRVQVLVMVVAGAIVMGWQGALFMGAVGSARQWMLFRKYGGA